MKILRDLKASVQMIFRLPLRLSSERRKSYSEHRSAGKPDLAFKRKGISDMKENIIFALTIVLVSFIGSPMFAADVDRSTPPKTAGDFKINPRADSEIPAFNGIKVVLMEKHVKCRNAADVLVETGSVNDSEIKSVLPT